VGFLVSIIAVIMTISGSGPISMLAGATLTEQQQFLQIFLAATIVPPLIIAAILNERSHAAQALGESEKRFRGLIEESPLGIQITDRHNKRLLANRAFMQMAGYDALEDLLAEPQVNLVAPSDRDRVKRFRNAIFEGSGLSTEYEFDLLRKDGSTVPVEAVAALIEWHGQPALQRTYIDLSGRRRAAKALKLSEDQYRLLVDLSPDAIFVHIDGKVVFVNPAMVDLMVADCAERLVGMDALDFLHPDQREQVMRIRPDMTGGNARVDFTEMRYIALDGRTIHTEGAANLINWDGKDAFMIVARDVTERRIAETALKDGAERLAKSQRTAHLGSSERDLVTGKVDWSDEMFRILGYEPGAVRPGPEMYLDCVSAPDREKVRRSIAAAIENGGSSETEFSIVRPNGEARYTSGH